MCAVGVDIGGWGGWVAHTKLWILWTFQYISQVWQVPAAWILCINKLFLLFLSRDYRVEAITIKSDVLFLVNSFSTQQRHTAYEFICFLFQAFLMFI